jgi:hypothetical protein
LLDWWYNGKTGRWVRRRRAQKRPMGLFIPQVIGPILNPGFRLLVGGLESGIGQLIHDFIKHFIFPFLLSVCIISQGAEFVNPFFIFL